ncbi:MAG: YfhO family protein [Clostridiales bacterium]|nr:YfhO family protein [Clostridiales bacterium]
MFPKLSHRFKNSLKYIAAFFIPVLILAASFSVIMATNGSDDIPPELTERHGVFDISWFTYASKEASDMASIRTALGGSDNLAKPEAARRLLTDHADIPFLMSFMLSEKRAFTFLAIAGFFRYGLPGLTMFFFIKRKTRIPWITALFLSTAYALSSPMLTSFGCPQAANLAAVFPLLMYFSDSAIRERSVRSVIFLAFAVFLTGMTGVTGWYYGLTMFLMFSFVLALGANETGRDAVRSMIYVFAGWFIGLFSCAAVIYPFIKYGNPIHSGQVDGEALAAPARFPFLDFLMSMTNGRIPSYDGDATLPSLCVTIFVLMLFIAFFFNGKIPLRMRVSSGIMLLLIYLSITFSIVDELLGLGNVTPAVMFVKLIGMSWLMIFIAAVSLRNYSFSKGVSYALGAAVIGLLIVGNSSGNDLSYGFVRLYFTGACAVFWVCFLITRGEGKMKGRLERIIFSVAFAGILFNTTFSLAPIHISSGIARDSYVPQNASEATFLPFLGAEDGEKEYILLTSDIREALYASDTVTVANAVSLASLENRIYTPVPSSEVYSKGLINNMPSGYTVEQKGTRCELIIRIDAGKGTAYYAQSTFTGRQILTEMYVENDIINRFDGPFIQKLGSVSPQINLRIALVEDAEGTGLFEVYSLDPEALSGTRSKVKTFEEDDALTVKAEDLTYVGGKRTVITSVPYVDGLGVYADGKSQETFDCGGRLGFVFDSEIIDGSMTFSVKSDSSDMTRGAVITCLVLVSLAGVCMYNVVKETGRVRKEEKSA